MKVLTPSNKRIIGIVASAASGLVLLMGEIPFLDLSPSSVIFSTFTFGQVLGVINLALAYMLYKRELR